MSGPTGEPLENVLEEAEMQTSRWNSAAFLTPNAAAQTYTELQTAHPDLDIEQADITRFLTQTAMALLAENPAAFTNAIEEISERISDDQLFTLAGVIPEPMQTKIAALIGQGGAFNGITLGTNRPDEVARIRKAEQNTAQFVAISAAAAREAALDAGAEWLNVNMSENTQEDWDQFLSSVSSGQPIPVQASRYAAFRESARQDLRTNPEYAEYNNEQLDEIIEELAVDKLMLSNEFETRAEAEGHLQNVIIPYLEQHPEEIQNIREQWRHADETAEAAALAEAQASQAMSIIQALETGALPLTDEMKEKAVITLDYVQADGTEYRVPMYVGTSIAEDGTILNEPGEPLQYFVSYDDETFQPLNLQYGIAAEYDQGAELAQQIENSGIQFEDLSEETRTYLIETGFTNMQSVADHYRIAESTHMTSPPIGLFMADEAFVNTVGGYGVQQEIESQQATGQVFANDPDLDEAAKNLAVEDLLEQQQLTLNSLLEQRATLEMNASNSIYGQLFISYLNEVNQKIEIIAEQLQAQIAETEAQIEIQAQAVQNSYSPDGLLMHDPLQSQSITGIVSPIATAEDNLHYQLETLENLQNAIDSIPEELRPPEPETPEDIEPSTNGSYLSAAHGLEETKIGSTDLAGHFSAVNGAPYTEPAPTVTPDPKDPELNRDNPVMQV